MLKKISLSILASVFFVNTFSAQQAIPEYNTLINKFLAAIENRSYKDMKQSAEELILNYRDDYAGYALYGYYFLCRGQNNQAEEQYNAMLQFAPVDPGAYYLAALMHYTLKRNDLAEKYLHWAFQLGNTEYILEHAIKDAQVVLEMANRPDLQEFQKMAGRIAQEYRSNNNTDGTTYANCLGAHYNGEDCSGFERAVSNLNLKRPHNPLIEIVSVYSKAFRDYMRYEPDKAIDGFDSFLTKSEPYKEQLRFLRAVAYNSKSYLNDVNYQYNIALLNINKAIDELRHMKIPTAHEAGFQFSKIGFQLSLRMEKESVQTANDLLSVANKIDNDYYRAQAKSILGGELLYSVLPADQARGTQLIYEALQLAIKSNDEELANKIKGNYTVALWQQGRKEESRKTFQESYNYYIARENYILAEVTSNNMGYLMMYDNNYEEAATYFKQAIDLTERVKKTLEPKQRLTLMNNRSSSYYGLVMAYEKVGNAAQLFEVQDNNRSQFLRDRLRPNTPQATLKEAQEMLGPDDLLLYYTLAAPGEVIINAITQNSAQVFHSYPIEDWIKMKKQWTDKTKKIPPSYNSFMQGYSNDIVDGNFVTYKSMEQNFNADDFKKQIDWTRDLLKATEPELTQARNSFLKQWYLFTLSPVQSLLNSKKNIIISPSNQLNYLPFEAFISPNGNYLIETHNVKYIPSVSVWKILNDRNYSPNRKPALAMGGAIYQPSGNVKGTARGIDDFFAISESINRKIERSNFNFKKELEQMGFGGATYLKGTLDEVKYVGEIDPEIKVVTGMDMKESYIKKLNTSGELKNYKIIMLSSHGFTTDIIPEFSGVMMSQPNEGDGNEDTFLLAPEIANFKLEADLAILSACDTGLGALTEGEGINGLNSAFLVAGANNTLLSLWAVDDYSTALTMKNLFRLMLKENMDSFEAINFIKRAMAKGEGGEKYSAPMYWAPFVLNGR
tara:strand:+ start:2774 stop:5638 length:2865 start_codon:yes stop_codon:yes gene_type:complete